LALVSLHNKNEEKIRLFIEQPQLFVATKLKWQYRVIMELTVNTVTGELDQSIFYILKTLKVTHIIKYI